MKSLLNSLLGEIKEENLVGAKALAKKNLEKGLRGWFTSESDLQEDVSTDLLQQELIKSIALDGKGGLIKVPKRKNVKEEKTDKNLLVKIPSLTFNQRGVSYTFVYMQMCRAFSFFSQTMVEERETCQIVELTGNPLLLVGVDHSSESYSKMVKAVSNGIKTKHSEYEYLLSSCAQTRTDSAWFLNSNVPKEDFFMKLTEGEWEDLKKTKMVIPKIAKYLGLSFTSGTKVSLKREIKAIYIDGIKSYRGEDLADGSFICTQRFMTELLMASGMDQESAKKSSRCALQVRFGWKVKGMLMSAPDKLMASRFGDAEVVFTGTTVKVGSGVPAAAKTGEFWIVNKFSKEGSEKSCQFMFTQNMLSMDEQAIEDEISSEFLEMQKALETQEGFMSYFNQGYDDISVADSLKAIVAANRTALYDPLIVNAVKYQFSHRIDDLENGKLKGCYNKGLLPDPSVFFGGSFDGNVVAYTEEEANSLLIKENECVTDNDMKDIIVMRSPSNMPGQIVQAKNIIDELSEKIVINGIEVSKEDLFYTDSPIGNFLFLCQQTNTQVLELAGADYDGDSAKIAAL